MAVGTKPMDKRGSFPIPKSICPASLLTPLCSTASICHHSLLRGHHGSRGRYRRGGPRGQFLGGEQLGSRFEGGTEMPTLLWAQPPFQGNYVAVSPSPLGASPWTHCPFHTCHRPATTGGQCSGWKTGIGCAGTWSPASRNVPASRRPMPSSWLTGPESGGVLWKRVSWHVGPAGNKGPPRVRRPGRAASFCTSCGKVEASMSAFPLKGRSSWIFSQLCC